MTKMPVLLQGHTLTPSEMIPCQSLSITLSMDQISTATLTVGSDAPAVVPGAWVMVFTPRNEAIPMRVKTVDSSLDRDTRTITLEHLIATLKDDIAFDDIQPETISGSDKCYASQALNYLLTFQTENIWRGGAVINQVEPYNFNSTTIYQGIQTIMSAMESPMLTFEMGSMPFTVNIVERPNIVQSEMRAARNIETMRVNIDRSQMFTRYYCRGKNDINLPNKYIQKNTELYGVISKVECDSTKETPEMLEAWAWAKLSKHCEPIVNITIGGYELSQLTGESMDNLALGYLCRVPLPDIGQTFEERITKLVWNDAIQNPDKVTVTLANTIPDVASIVRELQQSSGGGGAAKAKSEKEDHAWFVDTDTKVALVAEGVGGVDAEGNPNWNRVSELAADGTGIHGFVKRTEGELVTMQSSIDMNEEQIKLEVQNRQNADDVMSSSITQTADKIELEVKRATAAEGQMSSKITQTASEISMKVGKGEVISSINQTAEAIQIQASKINLTGYVTATEFDTEKARMDNLVSGKTVATVLNATTERVSFLSATDTFTFQNIPVTWKSQSVVTSVGSSTRRYFCYSSTSAGASISGTTYGAIIDGNVNTTTIYYLGR